MKVNVTVEVDLNGDFSPEYGKDMAEQFVEASLVSWPDVALEDLEGKIYARARAKIKTIRAQ